jgi:hypothetical protein
MTIGHAIGHTDRLAATKPHDPCLDYWGGGPRGEVARPRSSEPVLIGTTVQPRPKNPHVIAPGWAIGWESLQWIVYRVLPRARKSGIQHDQGMRMKPVSFVASGKPVLLRVLRENSVQPDNDGLAFISCLPPTFHEFIDRQEAVK